MNLKPDKKPNTPTSLWLKTAAIHVFLKLSSIVKPKTNLDLNGEQCRFDFNDNLESTAEFCKSLGQRVKRHCSFHSLPLSKTPSKNTALHYSAELSPWQDNSVYTPVPLNAESLTVLLLIGIIVGLSFPHSNKLHSQNVFQQLSSHSRTLNLQDDDRGCPLIGWRRHTSAGH